MRTRFLISVAAVAALLSSCGREPPRWEVPFNQDDAFTLAAMIMSEGRITGCGDFEVVSQQPISREITVSCNDGDRRTQHVVRYYPYLRVDGRDTNTNPWERRGLGDAYCVKTPDGKWDQAFIDKGKARKRAVELSELANKPARIYAVGEDSIFYWEAINNGKEWLMTIPTDEVRNPEEKYGCELGKS